MLSPNARARYLSVLVYLFFVLPSSNKHSRCSQNSALCRSCNNFLVDQQEVPHDCHRKYLTAVFFSPLRQLDVPVLTCFNPFQPEQENLSNLQDGRKINLVVNKVRYKWIFINKIFLISSKPFSC